MAGRSLIKELHEEMSCPICLEYFKDPVILDCGHNFCRACLTQCWEEEKDRAPSCPQCREIFQQKNLRPNWQLANLLELVKKLQAEEGAEGKWAMCERHLEALKLFCNDDQAPICLVCDKSMGHRNHNVLPMEEAFLEYKKKIQVQLQFLEQEREELKKEKTVEDQRSQTFLAQLEYEKQKTKSAFEQMQNYLEQQKQIRLSQLEEMARETEKRAKENLTRFSEELLDLSHLITELEGKFQQPETVFVQDPKTRLTRYEKKLERQLVELPPILTQNLRIYSEQTLELQKVLKECEESLNKMLVEVLTKEFSANLESPPSLKKDLFGTSVAPIHGFGDPQMAVVTGMPCFGELISQTQQDQWSAIQRLITMLANYRAVNVTLDPETAHPQLVLSENLKSVTGEWTAQNLLNNPERFDTLKSVLGREKFTSGRHWWEVDLRTATEWAVGIARESVKRKGNITRNPDEGFWILQAIQKTDLYSKYWQIRALTSSQIDVSSNYHEKIRVHLDYEEGCVEFFSASKEKLFTFPSTSFSGEMLRPYFSTGERSTLKC